MQTFCRFEHNVADKAVTDHDIAGAAQDISTLNVTDKIAGAFLKESKSLARYFIAFTLLMSDIQ